MAWLRNLAYNIFTANPPNRVIEVSTDSYSSRTTYKREECLILYEPSTEQENYEIVLQRPYHEATTKACSLCRFQSREAAELCFLRFTNKVSILVTVAKDTTVNYLQRICDTINEHPSWNVAHIAVHLQLLEPLSDPKIIDQFACEDPHDGISPLQLAITTENVKIIKNMLMNGAPVDHFDHIANSTMHYAASTNKKIVSLITEISKNTLNSKNGLGQTPLHVACARDKRECVTALLAAGADVNITSETGPGGGRGEPGLVGDPLQQFPGKLYQEDIKYGGTPLHWACSQEVIEALIEKKCDINCLNFHRQTALHMMVMRGRFDCVVSLLSHGADTTLRDDFNKTPIRIAVEKLDVQSVKALIVFNADLNDLTDESHSLRHGIPCGQNNAGDEILYILHSVGARRCGPDVRGCSPGCSAVDCYNGVAPPVSASSPSRDTLNLILEEATLPRNSTNYGRLLCLDGGGIRGLILVVMLMEIEKVVGHPIALCFDWIAGTSTGGILALAIAAGKSLQECLRIYFKLKNVVFVGLRPYPSEPLERILKEAFGENTTMTDLIHPKLMITATLVDRMPVDLHIFRNYPSPSNILEQQPPTSPWPDPEPAPLQKLWEAARATGAAPTYFNAAGRYIDGGLISNNPTLDAMTEIHEYNMSLKAMGRHEEATPLSIVVSLGTGSIPRTDNEEALGFLQRWANFTNLLSLTMGPSNFRALGQIINMLVDQATQADGRVVDRARAWCSSVGVPFFRLCPLLSKDIPLNETQNDKLIHMMYETRAYMHAKMVDLENLVTILKQPVTLIP